MEEKIKGKIQALADKVADDCGFELVDISLCGSGRNNLLRVTIDRDGGIKLDDCETFSRRLEGLLDVEDPIPWRYTLEVSSPGLDRPLKTCNDFKKNTGKPVRVITKEKIGNQSFFAGRLSEVHDDSIVLSVIRGKGFSEEIHIPLKVISSAKLEIGVNLK